MDKERFEKQLAFILEADKEKNILRQTHITGYVRRENDAEHAWHMAMMIYLLKEYSNEEFDVAKAMMMALIHDIVEIDAGDTYAYDTVALETQKEREERAAERIYGLLPDDQRDELRALFDEFEAGKTPEARFAKTMDNFQPLLLNDSNGGATTSPEMPTEPVDNGCGGCGGSSAKGSEPMLFGGALTAILGAAAGGKHFGKKRKNSTEENDRE